MQVGDMVEPSPHHGRYLPQSQHVGLIIKHHPAEGRMEECVSVLWGNGDTELEFPAYISLLSKAPPANKE